LTKDIRIFFTEQSNTGNSLVSDVIADLDFLLRDRLDRKNVKVNWSYDPDQVSSLAIPKTFLVNQVIANFLTNAIKFSPTDGVIDVAFSFADQFGRIIIQDYGVGMDEMQLKSVLEGRPKALGVGTSGELGSGSGVLIAQFFLKKFNGSISIESVRESDSKAQSGTKVIICVPTV
jgi:two-component system sensor histidine kinase GlrK